MSNKNTETNKNRTVSPAKRSKSKEIILIVSVVLLLIAIAVAMIIAVLHSDSIPDTITPQEGFKYPEYKNSSDTATEGIYCDTSKTGAGVDVDMEKVLGEVDAYKYSDFAKTDKQSDFAVIRVENYGDIVVALRGDIAPKTAENFKKLAADGFYTNMTFHRVRKDLMIQGGSKSAVGDDKTADTIYGEFTQNGHENNLLHKKGILSMGRSSERDSASSSFLIMHGDSTDFDGLYASFGYVIAGYDVVDKIASCTVKKSTDFNEVSTPTSTIVIKEVFFVEPIEGTGIGTSQSGEPQA